MGHIQEWTLDWKDSLTFSQRSARVSSEDNTGKDLDNGNKKQKHHV